MPDHNPDAARRRIEAALQRELALTRKAYRVRAACAAMQGIVSTIRSEADYGRLRILAKDAGFASVSEWIARESRKQADALVKELGL